MLNIDEFLVWWHKNKAERVARDRANVQRIIADSSLYKPVILETSRSARAKTGAQQIRNVETVPVNAPYIPSV